MLIVLIFASAGFSAAQTVHFDSLESIRKVDPNNIPDASVDFEATITHMCEMQAFMFVQNGKQAIFIHRPEIMDAKIGQRVRVQGRLAEGDLLPIVVAPIVTVLSEGNLPPAEHVEEIGIEHDSRYLHFEFEILQTSVGLTETLLHAKTESGIDVCIQVSHHDGVPLEHGERIAGHRIKCSGVLGLQITGGPFDKPGMSHTRINGYKIFCSSPDAVTIESTEKLYKRGTPHSVGLSSLEKNNFTDGCFHTFSQVCLVDEAEPRGIVVCDGPTFMRFDLESVYGLQPGMLIRIGGTKSTDQHGKSDVDVTHLYHLGMAEFAKRERLSVAQAVETYEPDRQITVEGTPLRIEKRGDRSYLILAENDSTIAVTFRDIVVDVVPSLGPEKASKVRVTGVSRPDEQCDFQLVVVLPTDAMVIESRTPVSRIVVIGVSILSLVCALAAMWIRLLKSQVAQKERFESIFDNAGCPIVVFNGDLEIVDVNQLAADMTGFSKDKLRSMSMPQIDTHTSLDKTEQILKQTLETQEVVVFRTTFQGKDGGSQDVEVHCRNLTISDAHEKATYIAIVPDTTSRNKYENQLKTARDEAIEANKAKSRFLAAMSHELRTPLNGVIGMTQLLECTELNSIQADYLAACRASGETLLTVIGDVLDFSKMEAGKLELAPQETELIPFIESIVQATSLQQKTQQVDLATFIDPRLQRAVMVDSDRLRQVIFNLIGNAAKFTSQGSITVTATCSSANDQYADVQFAVADTGIGIPEDRISRLFEAFEQNDSSTTREYGGTGLGLAICKQIVDLMGGNIQVESTEGVGSTFTVEVRLHFSSLFAEEEKGLCLTDSQRRPNVAVMGISAPVEKLISKTFAAYHIDVSFYEAHQVLPLNQYDTVFWNCQQFPECVTQLFEKQPALVSKNAPVVIPVVPANCAIDQQDWGPLNVRKPLNKPFSQTRLLQALASVQEDDQEAKAKEVSPNKSRCNGLRILLCEDVPVNQMFASEICRSAGIECVVCENGKVGIDTLRNDHQFDVIFMDCQMPIVDGFEATRIIREMSKNGQIPHIPIVALTANAVAGDRDKCLAAGMDDYLTKPFEIEPFLNKIYTNAAPSSEDQESTLDKTPNDTPIFDRDELACQFDDDVFAIQLATEFAGSLPSYQAELETSLEERDFSEAINVTHRLKGSAGTVKAERIRYLAIEMEATASDGKLDQLERQIAELVQEFDNFTTTVKQSCPNA